MPNDEHSGDALVESILAHEQAIAERDRLEIYNDPQWLKVLADSEYKKLNQQLNAQMAKLPADMPWSTKINTPAVLKLIQDIHLMERRFGADRRPLWQRADTPERFRDGIARFAYPFLCTTAGEVHWVVLHDMFKKAVELSIKFDLPAPPEPPAENVTLEHRRNYLLKLRDWSHGKDAGKSGIALPITTLSTPTAAAPAQTGAAGGIADGGQDEAVFPKAVDDDSHLAPSKLAAIFCVPLSALNSRLKRWRSTAGSGYIENSDRKPREPQYLYRVGCIRSILDDLKATSERPGK